MAWYDTPLSLGKTFSGYNLAKGVYNTALGSATPVSTEDLNKVGTQAATDAGAFRGLNPSGIEGGLATSLQDTISGKTPSVAQGMLANQTQQNAQQQLGFASGLGGLNAALARRTAADNVARMNQQAARDQSILRAHEISSAQGALGTLGANISQQQLDEEKLREQAQADRANANIADRKNNIKVTGAIAQGLGSGFSPLGGGGGGG